MGVGGGTVCVWVMVVVMAAGAGAYSRASDAVIGTRVSCSPEEKLCFRFNRVLSAADGKCLPLLAQCGEGGEGVLVAGRKALEQPLPRLQAECVSAGRCPRHLQSLFWPSGECLEPEAAAAACGGAGPTLNLFGEWECWCAEAEGAAPNASRCDAPVAPPQPSEEGSCVVPDLWRPLPAADTQPPALAAPCTIDEHRCFAQGKLLFQGACVEPLSRGPCAEGQWLVLDRAAHAANPAAALRAACAPRPCAAEGQLWLDFEHVRAQDQCQTREDVATRLCLNSEEVHEDAFGYARCIKKGSSSPFSLLTARENGICQPAVTATTTTTQQQLVTSPQPPAETACTNPPCSVVPVVPSTESPTQEVTSTVTSPSTEQVVIVTGISIPPEEYNTTESSPESHNQSDKIEQSYIEPSVSLLPPVSPTIPSIYQLPPIPDNPSIEQLSHNPEDFSNLAVSPNPEVHISSQHGTSPIGNVQADQKISNVQSDQQLCVGPSCFVSATAASVILQNQEPATNQSVSTPQQTDVLGGVHVSSPQEQQISSQEPCTQTPCPFPSVIAPTAQSDQKQTNGQIEQQSCVGSSCFVSPTPAPIVLPNQETSTTGPTISTPQIKVIDDTNILSQHEQQSTSEEPCTQTPCPVPSAVAPTHSTITQEQSNPTVLGYFPQITTGASPSPQNNAPLENNPIQQQLIEHQPCITLPCPSPQSYELPTNPQQPLNFPFSAIPASPTIPADSFATEQQKVETAQVNLPVVPDITGSRNTFSATVPSQQINAAPQIDNTFLAAPVQPNGQINIPSQTGGDVSLSSIQQGNINIPIISLENVPGRVPAVPLQNGVPVPPGLDNASLGSLQPGQSDAVVNYVLLGQSNLPINSV